ncbi:hypothetical protein THRCLA_07581 [Thraustotheca clavata]|uniref:Uncharacterized protein n=1 Tax=Thraustotheca clavata TaxID=74557 RepID=A0A1V9ZCQ5_9STRA|nr:hypothetical protein THRCLA_07581 [Thraustotheca clavata]
MKLVKKWCGVTYLLISMTLSILYIEMINDSMANDLFWPSLSPNGAHSYLLDLFSQHLLVNKQNDLDIFDASSAIIDKYDAEISTHILWPSYPRSIVYTQLTTVEDAIQGFRSFDTFYTISLFTQYCWVDFDNRWEMAHTIQRQARCYQRYQQNGAVYLEAILRNIDWDKWLNGNSQSFMIGIGNFLLQSSDGQLWLSNEPHAFKSIDTEVKYWKSKGITEYILQWNNRIQTGISESIAVVNAFGWRQPLTMYHIAHSAREPSWTTFGLYWSFTDDLWVASISNGSIVRNSTNFLGDTSMEDNYYVYPFTSASIVIHDLVGPFQSIDTFFISPPIQLTEMIATFNSIFIQAFQTNATLFQSYKNLPTLTLDPIPKTWQQSSYQYYGGGPLCNARNSTTFVQASFSFDDICGQPKPLQILIRQKTALFAYIRLRSSGISVKDPCGLCLTTEVQCLSALNQLEIIYNDLIANSTIHDILTNTSNLVNCQVEMIQLASLNDTSFVLRQNILQDEWFFFGYIELYEWVYGEREVVSFEGDAGTFVVLSERLNGFTFAANQKDIPNTTSQYLWGTTIATTFLLLTVALLTLFIYVRSTSYSSYHLLFFNRIVGPVWLGRPLMIVRSATAIVILSTSPIVFDSSNGFGRFLFEPRSFGYRMLLASEASWLTDVMIDILLIFTQDIAPVLV